MNNEESFRNMIGYVTQNPYVIDDSILNNITISQNQKKINLSRVNSLLKKIEETLKEGLIR